MKMGHFQDFEVHSRAKPVPWVAHTGELLVSYVMVDSITFLRFLQFLIHGC